MTKAVAAAVAAISPDSPGPFLTASTILGDTIARRLAAISITANGQCTARTRLTWVSFTGPLAHISIIIYGKLHTAIRAETRNGPNTVMATSTYMFLGPIILAFIFSFDILHTWRTNIT